MILSFFTRPYSFFDLLEEQVSHAVEAARFFQQVVVQDRVSEEMLSQMARIEQQEDEAAHAIIERLNKTFLTPLDRRDTMNVDRWGRTVLARVEDDSRRGLRHPF